MSATTARTRTLAVVLAGGAGSRMGSLTERRAKPALPFGGTKGSSYGPKEQGKYAAEFYTQVKTITARWPTGIRAGAEFVMPTMK